MKKSPENTLHLTHSICLPSTITNLFKKISVFAKKSVKKRYFNQHVYFAVKKHSSFTIYFKYLQVIKCSHRVHKNPGKQIKIIIIIIVGQHAAEIRTSVSNETVHFIFSFSSKAKPLFYYYVICFYLFFHFFFISF